MVRLVSGRVERGKRWRSGRRRMFALLVLGAIAIASGLGSSSVAAAPSQDKPVIQLDIGYDGTVAAGRRVPIRVTVTAPRAFKGKLSVNETNSGSTLVASQVELSAGVPFVVLTGTAETLGAVEVVLTDDGDSRVASAVRPLESNGTMAVGLGSSLTPPTADLKAADLVDAVVVPFDDEWWEWDAALFGLDQIVMSASDVDRLTSDQATRLRSWVETGGALTIDSAPNAQALGWTWDVSRTRQAMGMGWVTFSNGAAGSGDWSKVLEVPTVAGWNEPGAMWNTPFFRDTRRLNLLPTRWVALMAFGFPILLGPVVWFALGARRRGWIWALAPLASVAVAALVMVGGRGAFNSSEVKAGFDGLATSGEMLGDLSVGVKASDGQLTTTGGPELVLLDGPLSARNAGADLTVTARDALGTSGELRLSGYRFAQSEWLDVEATVELVDGEEVAKVEITNRSSEPINLLTLHFAAHESDIAESLDPGASKLIGVVVPATRDPLSTAPSAVRGRGVPVTSGLVTVVASRTEPRDFGFGKVDTLIRARTSAPLQRVVGDADPRAALRVDSLRTVDFFESMAGAFDGPVTVEDNAGGDDLLQDLTFAFRITAGTDFAGGTCAVHSTLDRLSMRVADGGWVPVETPPDRESELMSNHGVADVAIPPLKAGESVMVRSDASLGFRSITEMVNCMDPGPEVN